MVSSKEGGLIYNIKLSSVGPGRVTGQDVVFEPNGIDLAMKLHYIRVIYYFNSQAFEGISIRNIKEPMFTLFNPLYMSCGRFRRTEYGRPYIKCNDCGVRFVEAQCEKTLDEWLQLKDDSLEKLLVSDNIIGPELGFSPLVFLQYTKFKCGGMAIGLSFAHVLGDAFSAAEFMNLFGKVMKGYNPPRPLNLAQSLTKTHNPQTGTKVSQDPLSVKRVDPVGDNWIAVNNCKMETFSFPVNAAKLIQIQSEMGKTKFDTFECLCAVIWQSVAKFRTGASEPKVVTICRKDTRNDKVDGILSNSQMINVVKAEFSVVDANLSDLAGLIKNGATDETKMVEETMEKGNGVADFVIYGANLTFVNLEEENFYGLECKGQMPVRVSCFIDGVGDEGAVLVLPGGAKDDGSSRIVTLILPDNELKELKSELKLIM